MSSSLSFCSGGKGVYSFFLVMVAFFLLGFDLFELGEEPIPVLVLEGRVFHEFPLDHEFFDVVDGVNILHGVDDDPPHDLETLEPPNQTDCPSLHQNVALGQQLQGLQGVSVGTNQPLPPLDEPLLVAGRRICVDREST